VAGGSEGSGVSADLGAIVSTAAWMDGVAEDFDNNVQALYRQVQALLERWRGSAADSHAEAWSDWRHSAVTLAGALEDDATALRAAATGYTGIDAQTGDNLHAADDAPEMG
jgi:WXG100 family type VII secretion target